MNIDHFVVHVCNKSVSIEHEVVLEIDVYLTPNICLRGFKLKRDLNNKVNWSIPQYYCHLSSPAKIEPILNNEGKKFIIDQLTKAMISVKLVLTRDSYGKSYLVKSDRATLMAQ